MRAPLSPSPLSSSLSSSPFWTEAELEELEPLPTPAFTFSISLLQSSSPSLLVLLPPMCQTKTSFPPHCLPWHRHPGRSRGAACDVAGGSRMEPLFWQDESQEEAESSDLFCCRRRRWVGWQLVPPGLTGVLQLDLLLLLNPSKFVSVRLLCKSVSCVTSLRYGFLLVQDEWCQAQGCQACPGHLLVPKPQGGVTQSVRQSMINFELSPSRPRMDLTTTTVARTT